MSHSTSSVKKAVLHGQHLRCKNGCGYFGNPEWQSYCSLCYKELNQKVKPESTKTTKKVMRSLSDAHEIPLSLGFTKFEEKKKQQSEKKSKTIKSIIKRGHTSKDSVTHSPSREVFSAAEISEWGKEHQLKDAATKDVIKQINYQLDLMHKHFDKSIDEQSEIMQEFYNFMTNRFETHHYYQEMSSEQIDQLLDSIEEKLMKYMYTPAFNQISTEYEEKDLALQNRIRSLNWITAQRLGLEIKENSPEIRELIDKAITDVIEMNSKIGPQQKINCIVNCCKNILNIINLCQGVTVSADELLPALVYVVLKANPPLLHSNVKYITSYSIPIRLRSGEGAYYFTNMCCAVEFIEHLTAESLNLTNEEFERYLAGEVPLDYTEQSITACEGIRIMSQNLITLTEVQEKNNKILIEMLALKEEMTKMEETILKCKPTSPLKINPTPYTITAHVDMSLIPEILRDRVYVEESGEILVDLSSKMENKENSVNHASENTLPNNFNRTTALVDFQNISLDNEHQPYSTNTGIGEQTVIQPLCVALPENSSSSGMIPNSTLPVQNGVSHPVLNIKDLEYPTEIFPDKSDESLGSPSHGSDVCLIDPISSDTGLMEDLPPPLLNLPPPLQPVVIQSNKPESTD